MKLQLAEEELGKLTLGGSIEVPHMPAVGDTFMHQNIVSGRGVKHYAKVTRLLPSIDKRFDALMIYEILSKEIFDAPKV